MKYKLQKGEGGQAPTLTISGNLNIQNSEALHQLLLECGTDERGLCLQLQKVEEMDITFLQLLLALACQLEARQKPFYLHLDLNPSAAKLLQLSGLSSLLYINH